MKLKVVEHVLGHVSEQLDPAEESPSLLRIASTTTIKCFKTVTILASKTINDSVSTISEVFYEAIDVFFPVCELWRICSSKDACL